MTTPIQVEAAYSVQVFRYVPGSPGTYTALPNIQCIQVEQKEGDPGVATFRYDWTWPDPNAPSTVEEAVTTTTPYTLVIKPGDRIVVRLYTSETAYNYLFDGKALDWDVQITAHGEEVYVTALGIAHDEWATPMPGMLMRDADDPAAIIDVQTDMVAQFNPKGIGNSTIVGQESGTVSDKYPVFIDPTIVRTPAISTTWTLKGAVAYILNTQNHGAVATNPDAGTISALFIAKAPITGTPFDPNNPATYSSSDITVADTPFTGRDWPTALTRLIRDYGFGYYFALSSNTTGDPKTTLTPYFQQGGPQKTVTIQARGSTLDRNITNTQAAHITRKLRDVVNVWQVKGALIRYEVSLILQCGFPMVAADMAPANIMTWDKSALDPTAGPSDGYRLFIFGEVADPMYLPAQNFTTITAATSLDSILGSGNYAFHHRQPIGELFTSDIHGKPLRARLDISTNYTGTIPGVWDGTGTWQQCHGGWELLPDRLGIRLTCPNPENWHIEDAKTTSTTAPYPTGMIEVVSGLATNAAPFTLRLTCVIEGDQAVMGTQLQSLNSALSQTITRIIDARDRIKKQIVAKNSHYNNTANPITNRDDTAAATAEAEAVAYTTQAGALHAHITIDHLCLDYSIGDRISQIAGRNTPLRTDKGMTGENPVLPVVVGRRFVCWPEQRTELECTDAGADLSLYRLATKQGHARIER